MHAFSRFGKSSMTFLNEWDFFPSLNKSAFQRFHGFVSFSTGFGFQNASNGVIQGIEFWSRRWPFILRDEIRMVVSEPLLRDRFETRSY